MHLSILNTNRQYQPWHIDKQNIINSGVTSNSGQNIRNYGNFHQIIIKMARLIILIAIAAIALILWHKITKTKGEERKKLMLWSLVGMALAILAILAITGHLNLITATIAGLVAFIPRLLQYAKYLPFLSNAVKKHASPGGQTQPPPSGQGKQKMTRNEAIDILALKPDYKEADVITAHRRMMQKVHPDRGGSDYLAAQINQAKEILLG